MHSATPGAWLRLPAPRKTMAEQWKNNTGGRLNAFSHARGLAEAAGVGKNNGETIEKQWGNNG